MSDYTFTLQGVDFFFYNHGLFENLTFPEGIDKDVFIENLLDRYGEFEPIYLNIDYFKNVIGIWSKKHQRTFEKWVKALSIEYNPLENYDRYEESEDDGSTSSASSINNENKKSAYDTKSYTPFEKNENSVEDEGENHFTHTAHLHGNIGVTKAQEMLRDELDVAKWNLYDNLALLFAEEFLILVY